jgi:hypothetical protein
VNLPRAAGGESIGSIVTPLKTAGPPNSDREMWAMRSTRTASPGWVCVRIATALHIAPLGRKTPASFPSNSATIAWSRLVVGSSRRCSSATSASAMARRIPGDGLVRVSE